MTRRDLCTLLALLTALLPFASPADARGIRLIYGSSIRGEYLPCG